MTVLHSVKELGQQIWLDSLSRTLTQEGVLQKRLEEGVSGVTSNPTIFYQAFSKDALYQDDIQKLKSQKLSAKERYEKLAIYDVQAACDVFHDLFVSSNGQEGFVSLEVSPQWAHDAAGTVTEALRLWGAVNRPNLMIKVPTTDAGLDALTVLVSEGLNVNLTLLFSRLQAKKAYQAYVKGLQIRVNQGLPIDGIFVVASFFLSRVDSALDECLPVALRGKAAIALARMAYADWHTFFGTDEFISLRAKGAKPVSLLWASTGTKNPAYSDVLYVESLIGPSTVNTVPTATLDAFMDHGRARLTLSEQDEDARLLLDELIAIRVDFEALGMRLQQEGLLMFDEAFDKLLEILE